jgi:hypothetical protein
MPEKYRGTRLVFVDGYAFIVPEPTQEDAPMPPQPSLREALNVLMHRRVLCRLGLHEWVLTHVTYLGGTRLGGHLGRFTNADGGSLPIQCHWCPARRADRGTPVSGQ